MVPTATPEPTETGIAEPSPPEPTETATPKETVTVNGYIFSLPQEIPSTRQISGVEIVDWLPGSSNEVLLQGIFDLGVLNIETGGVTIYATVKEPGNIRFPIWIPQAQGVAYFSSDIQTNQQNLWLGKTGSNNRGVQLLGDGSPPLIPLNQGLAVYSPKDKAVQGITPDGQKLSTPPAAFNRLSPAELEQLGATARHTAIQPRGEWIAITRHNSIGGVQFLNSQTEEARLIDLGGEKSAPLWVLNAKWSPDGQKLGLIVTQGIPPVHFSDLYLLEWPAATLNKVDLPFQFIKDIAWGPDSKHLLIQSIINQENGFVTLALYLMDVSIPSDIIPVPIPTDGLSSGQLGGGLGWSPDGQKILVKYSDDIGDALYQMEVTPQ
jgi:Tol biopolymer transport system component